MSNAFCKHHRLLTKDDFSIVLKNNTGRIAGDVFLILYRQNNRDHARLGLALAKKVIKKASDRNRIKRLVRESYRKKSNELGALDIVVLGRQDIALKNNQHITESLGKIWQRLKKQ